MNYNVRLATIDDAHALSQLGAATFTETFGTLYKREDLVSFLEKSHAPSTYERVLQEGSYVAVAHSPAGRLVGYAVAGVCTLPVPCMGENAGELGRLYVLQEAQGTGLGRQLLAGAMTYLQEAFEEIYLSVYAENFRAQKIYAALGFRKVHDYFYMVGNHADPEWIMRFAPDVDADEFGCPEETD